jgi:aryl-alcohol dehydrogenase-like predicted oxidoreductase
VIERIELAPGYSVCRIINGLWQLSHGHHSKTLDKHRTIESLLRLVDAGFTTFDCADIYLGVEELLGSMMREVRRSHRDPETIGIHTKYVPDRSALATLKRPDVAASIDASLTRLGVDRLDLVQFHWWNFDLPNYVEVAGWLTELGEEGKIRLLGTTNFNPSRLHDLVKAGIPVVTNQVQYSLLDRRPEGAMTTLCEEHGIQLLCYGVLAGGFLAERHLGVGEPEPPFENRSLAKYKLIIDEFGGWKLQQQMLETLQAIAIKHATTIAVIAARWVLDRDPVAAVMIGARSHAHIDDNLEVFDLRLDEKDRDQIDRVLARAEGPVGEPFDLEREPDDRHSQIMWTDLNRRRNS